MWSDLQREILEDFVGTHVSPADQSFFNMDGFRMFGGPETEERKAAKRDSARRILIAERAALSCSECGARLTAPKMGKRPTTCGGKCRLKRLYSLRARRAA